MPETYICESCGELFPLARDPEEEQAEFEELFPEHQEEDKVRLCEPCHVKLMKKAEKVGLAPKGWRKYLDKERYPD